MFAKVNKNIIIKGFNDDAIAKVYNNVMIVYIDVNAIIK